MRIDRALLDRAEFKSSVIIPVRMADLDMQWHVNNVRATELLQEARFHFMRDCGMADAIRQAQRRPVVVSKLVEYASEMSVEHPIEVFTAISRLGSSSVVFSQKAQQCGRNALYAQITLVMLGESGPESLPEAIRQAARPHLIG